MRKVEKEKEKFLSEIFLVNFFPFIENLNFHYGKKFDFFEAFF